MWWWCRVMVVVVDRGEMRRGIAVDSTNDVP